jgi:curli biogenesis system outer membrane secretion channel CsgG
MHGWSVSRQVALNIVDVHSSEIIYSVQGSASTTSTAASSSAPQATTPGEMHSVSLAKLRKVFGADAVLDVTIEEYGQKYQVLSSTTVVEARANLLNAKIGAILWNKQSGWARGLLQPWHCSRQRCFRVRTTACAAKGHPCEKA